MNVGFAWNLAPKWSCRIVAMQCASNATEIGNLKITSCHCLSSYISMFSSFTFNGFYIQITGTQNQSPVLFAVVT